MNMGEIIKKERLKNGWTQEELGDKLDFTKSMIAKYENGHVEKMKRSKIE